MRAASPTSETPGIRLAYGLAGAVALVACAVTVSWAADLPALRSIIPGYIPMMPLTALALLCLSASLAALAGGRAVGWRLAAGRAAALAGATIGVVTLAEHLLARDLGIDHLLFPRAVAEAWQAWPGRPAIDTSICVTLLGVGLLGLPWALERRAVGQAIQGLALATVVPIYLTALGYVYDVSALYSWMHSAPMALLTAATLLSMAVALIAGTPGASLPALLTSRGTAGQTMRRLVAPTLLGPIVLGWLRLEAEHTGLIPRIVGLELMVLTLALGGFGFLWWSTARFAVAEDELIDLYENAPCGYHSLDREGRVVRINDTELAWLGYSREEIVGERWDETLLHEDGRERFRATFPGFVARGWVKDLQLDLRRKDGSAFPVLVTATALRDEAGAFMMSRSTLFDMTEHRRLEDAHRRSEARVRSVLEASPDALLLIDAGGRVSYANAFAAELYGYAPATMIGLSVEKLVPEAIREAHRTRRDGHSLGTGAWTMAKDREVHGVRQDGGEFPAEVRLSPVETPGGPFIIVSVRDISERQRMLAEAARRTIETEQARELARVKDYLLSTISHEMKTPVSLIVGYAEMLEDTYPDEAIVKGLLEGAHRLATHMNRIIDLGALLSGAMPLYRSEVDPVELVEATHRLIGPELAAARVRWVGEIAPGLPSFEGDPHRLAQMLAELVDNARRFTPAGGTVGLKVGSVAGNVVFTVWDNGPGIEPRQLDQVWEAFNQLRTSDALRPGGLGLGLALVKGIAELHGGRVSLSCPAGGGTEATVSLPARPDGGSELVRDDGGREHTV